MKSVLSIILATIILTGMNSVHAGIVTSVRQALGYFQSGNISELTAEEQTFLDEMREINILLMGREIDEEFTGGSILKRLQDLSFQVMMAYDDKNFDRFRTLKATYDEEQVEKELLQAISVLDEQLAKTEDRSIISFFNWNKFFEHIGGIKVAHAKGPLSNVDLTKDLVARLDEVDCGVYNGRYVETCIDGYCRMTCCLQAATKGCASCNRYANMIWVGHGYGDGQGTCCGDGTERGAEKCRCEAMGRPLVNGKCTCEKGEVLVGKTCCGKDDEWCRCKAYGGSDEACYCLVESRLKGGRSLIECKCNNLGGVIRNGRCCDSPYYEINMQTRESEKSVDGKCCPEGDEMCKCIAKGETKEKCECMLDSTKFWSDDYKLCCKEGDTIILDYKTGENRCCHLDDDTCICGEGRKVFKKSNGLLTCCKKGEVYCDEKTGQCG